VRYWIKIPCLKREGVPSTKEEGKIAICLIALIPVWSCFGFGFCRLRIERSRTGVQNRKIRGKLHEHKKSRTCFTVGTQKLVCDLGVDGCDLATFVCCYYREWRSKKCQPTN
jgi:hypothetical protein